ncbi:MAG TPA: hypothetical protein DCO86_01950 [Spirochaetaceae bacterium]|nr:hypothetical protein [Spirochaetaceae bacterium]
MKNRIKFVSSIRFAATAVLLLLIGLASCNEASSISIMQGVSTSREKSAKVWRQAEVAYATDAGNGISKVDFVFLIANDGLHVVSANTDQSADEFLTKATILNGDENFNVKGLVRGICIPSTYSSQNPVILIQTVENSIASDSMHYYSVDLKSPANFDPSGMTVSELSFSQDAENYVFVSKSLVNASHLIMYRTKNIADTADGSYEYHIGHWTIADGKLGFSSVRSFRSGNLIYGFWEDSDAVNAAVLYTTVGDDDIQKQDYYSIGLGDHPFDAKHYDKLKDIRIRNFIVYPDGKFMGITQSGNILHSEVDRSYNYTADSSFSYNRYTPPVVFRHDGSDTPAVTVFARYNGNGFIIYCYNKTPEDNKIYNSTDEYKGHVQTAGFAENLRSEEISELYPVILKSSEKTEYKILVLSTENGLATYSFDSIKPMEMRTNGTEASGRIAVFGS